MEVHTDWRVTGTSKPSQVEYNNTQEMPDKYTFEEELGEEVIHVYDIKNRGPSTIQEAEVFILWPSFDNNKDHLLYLLGVDFGGDDGKVVNINVKGNQYKGQYQSYQYKGHLRDHQEHQPALRQDLRLQRVRGGIFLLLVVVGAVLGWFVIVGGGDRVFLLGEQL